MKNVSVMGLYSPETYSRSNMAAMLASMPLEERRWTLNYLINIMVTPDSHDAAGSSSSADFTRRMLEKHCGTWVGDESSDDIMASIRSNSSIRKPIEL